MRSGTLGKAVASKRLPSINLSHFPEATRKTEKPIGSFIMAFEASIFQESMSVSYPMLQILDPHL